MWEGLVEYSKGSEEMDFKSWLSKCQKKGK